MSVVHPNTTTIYGDLKVEGDISGLKVKGVDISGTLTDPVDPSLDITSVHPVQNQAIKAKFDSVDTEVGKKLNKAGDTMTGILNSSQNNFIVSTNDTDEFNFVPTLTKDLSVYINHKQTGGNSAGNYKIKSYEFRNGIGSCVGVTVKSETFEGNLTGNVTGNITGDAGGKASSADKLNIKDGNETKPVYFKDGVPVECTSADLNVTSANTAIKLKNDNKIGDIGVPVYFQGGLPKVCTSMDLKAASAGKADNAITVGSTTENTGSATQPIYLVKGVPTKCNAVKTIKLQANYTSGGYDIFYVHKD